MDKDTTRSVEVSRRRFLVTSAAGSALPLAATVVRDAGAQVPSPAAAARTAPQPSLAIVLTVNGTDHRLNIDPRTTLLDALREHIGLVGSKKGCDHGQCGACTVLVNGERVLACLSLAAQAQGAPVTTIEGLARGDELHPMQQAFIDNDAFQCGYCTPGQIVSAIGCVQEGRLSGDDEIREYMSGNLCRCAAYPNIVEAIREAATKMRRSA